MMPPKIIILLNLVFKMQALDFFSAIAYQAPLSMGFSWGAWLHLSAVGFLRHPRPTLKPHLLICKRREASRVLSSLDCHDAQQQKSVKRFWKPSKASSTGSIRTDRRWRPLRPSS